MITYSISVRGSPKWKAAVLAAYDAGGGRARGVETALRTLARRAGLRVVTCREDGNGNGARHYQATLGTRCRGGGHTPRVEVWVFTRKVGGAA